jgi:predicted GIY-YIG superfamily endonuclease
MDPTNQFSFVYLLLSTKGCTYIGATINLNRRLRQHNGEIKGGAKRTTMKVGQGEEWRRVCYVGGFPDWQAALQFEWRWKQLSRNKQYKMEIPIQRRINALCDLIQLERSTTKAVPFHEWTSLMTIYLEKIEKIDITKIIKYANNIKYVNSDTTPKTDSTESASTITNEGI